MNNAVTPRFVLAANAIAGAALIITDHGIGYLLVILSALMVGVGLLKFVPRSKTVNDLSKALFELDIKHQDLQRDHAAMISDWNKLVNRINRLGGEDFLRGSAARQRPAQFDADDVKRLLMLCHPDKHGGKQMAVDMTAKLIKIKETT